MMAGEMEGNLSLGLDEETSVIEKDPQLPSEMTLIKSEPKDELYYDDMQLSTEVKQNPEDMSSKPGTDGSLNKLVCNLCFQLFASKDTLRNHIKSKHTVKNPSAIR